MNFEITFDNIILMNSANMPADGVYIKRTISKNQFISLVKKATNIKSSIGYESVSTLIKRLTGVSIEVNRGLTLIDEPYNIVGLTLDYRVNPKEKGYTEPNEDDYIYFIAIYSRNEKLKTIKTNKK